MLLVNVEGPIMSVRLNRPEVRNAFNDELIDSLTTTFSRLPSDVRAVVLSGEGQGFAPEATCSG